MRWRRRASPGDLVYASTGKLYEHGAQVGLRTRSLEPRVELSGEAGVRASLPPVAGAAAHGAARAVQVDPGKEVRLLHRHLERMVALLGRLPDLEAADSIREGQWFSFRRRLSFAVGHADAEPSINALIVVDAERESPPSVPGLLMNGSVTHVRDPYSSDELHRASGVRSGSGTDRLFIWLEEVRRQWDTDPEAELRTIRERTRDGARSASVAHAMYSLFCRKDWITDHFAVPVVIGAFCEGVARASFVAPGEERTVVMGSPLYVRMCEEPRVERVA